MGWTKHLVCIVVIFCLQFWKAGSRPVWPLWGSASAGWWGVVMCREEKGHWAVRYLGGDWVLLLLLFFFWTRCGSTEMAWAGEHGKNANSSLTLSHLIAEYCAYSYLSLACRLSKARLGRGGEAKLACECKNWNEIVIFFQLFASAYW